MIVEITEPPKPTRTWMINTAERYAEVIEAVRGPAPEPNLLGSRHAVELDMWLTGPVVYELMWFARDAEFAIKDEDEQRWIMAFAAECLYGPRFDVNMLCEAVIWANDDEGL